MGRVARSRAGTLARYRCPYQIGTVAGDLALHLLGYADLFCDSDPDGRYREAVDRLRLSGVWFWGRDLPHERSDGPAFPHAVRAARPRPKECYRNCQSIACLGVPGYTYHDGYMIAGDFTVPVEHAWLVRGGHSRVVDVTMDQVPGVGRDILYWGLSYTLDEVCRHMARSGAYDPLTFSEARHATKDAPERPVRQPVRRPRQADPPGRVGR